MLFKAPTLPGAGTLKAHLSTDNGGNERDVLTNSEKNGHGGVTLDAYADVDPQNFEHVKEAIADLGGVDIGLDLPLTAQSQTVWDAVDEGPKTFCRSFSQSSLRGALATRATRALGAAMRVRPRR